MRISVLGFRSDLRIELQAPVIVSIFIGKYMRTKKVKIDTGSPHTLLAFGGIGCLHILSAG